ncbi:hypothetical protein TcCL_ESM04078 [Trypanosoma cruzi]|nr:hypothetical protein TcCL_ESM04078 [Trypanosoma cruzi]
MELGGGGGVSLLFLVHWWLTAGGVCVFFGCCFAVCALCEPCLPWGAASSSLCAHRQRRDDACVCLPALVYAWLSSCCCLVLQPEAGMELTVVSAYLLPLFLKRWAAEDLYRVFCAALLFGHGGSSGTPRLRARRTCRISRCCFLVVLVKEGRATALVD